LLAGMCVLNGLDIAAVFDLAEGTVFIGRRGLMGTQTTQLRFGEIASVGLTRHQDENGYYSYALEMQGSDGSRHLLSDSLTTRAANDIVQKIEAATRLSRKDRDASLADTIEPLKKLFQKKR